MDESTHVCQVILGALVKSLRSEPGEVRERIFNGAVALLRELVDADREKWEPLLTKVFVEWGFREGEGA